MLQHACVQAQSHGSFPWKTVVLGEGQYSNNSLNSGEEVKYEWKREKGFLDFLFASKSE